MLHTSGPYFSESLAKSSAKGTNIAPYLLQIIPKIENDEKVEEANNLYEDIKRRGIGTILDDRTTGTIGSKIKDCKVLGTPFMAVIGDKVEKGKVELENTEEYLEIVKNGLIEYTVPQINLIGTVKLGDSEYKHEKIQTVIYDKLLFTEDDELIVAVAE